jgi:hypothetical protein
MTSEHSPISRPITQPSANDSAPGQVIDVDVLELRLPCRSFRINYKVAETGKLSLTSEFLLRLLRSTDGLREDAIAEFFGFSEDETRFVVDHIDSLGYVIRANGRVHLTEAGHSLFNAGSDEPALFEVQSKQERFDFDLIAFAPVENTKPLTNFEYRLPELPLADATSAANASKYISSSFKRHFQEFRFKRGGSRLEKQALYTVDDVQAEQRYSTTLPVTVSIRSDNPGFPEANLLSWKTGFELEDRAAIVQSCATFLRSIRIAGDQSHRQAGEILIRCAPDQVSRFRRDDGLDFDAFFRSTAKQAGELRVDRPTVRVLGHVWTDANRSRFASALEYAFARSGKACTMQIWLRPTLPTWGMTTRLQDTLAAVARHSIRPDAEIRDVRAIMIGDEKPPRAFSHMFNAIVRVPARHLPPGLEIFLIPGRLAFIVLHTPVGTREGYPVPMGVMSFDPKVVERAHGIISDILAGAHPTPTHCDWQSTSILGEIDAALDFSA